jgi:NADH:ubiquinone oxidoreductase subunit E
VTCLAACDKAPMFQIQGPNGIKYHENMTVDKTMELVETLKKSVGEGK